jgi:hypothetical protein
MKKNSKIKISCYFSLIYDCLITIKKNIEGVWGYSFWCQQKAAILPFRQGTAKDLFHHSAKREDEANISPKKCLTLHTDQPSGCAVTSHRVVPGAGVQNVAKASLQKCFPSLIFFHAFCCRAPYEHPPKAVRRSMQKTDF